MFNKQCSFVLSTWM